MLSEKQKNSSQLYIGKTPEEIFAETINELATIQLFYYFDNETIFNLSDNFNSIITSLKFDKLILIQNKLEKSQESKIKENILLCKQKKSFTATETSDYFVSSIPVHKNNGEMIFYISLLIKSGSVEMNENLLLFLEMLSNIFYKNHIIRNLMDNVSLFSSQSTFTVKPYSEREEEIIQFVMAGYPDKMLCRKLNISMSTLRKNLQNIYNNMEAANKFEFIIKYSSYRIASIYERT